MSEVWLPGFDQQMSTNTVVLSIYQIHEVITPVTEYDVCADVNDDDSRKDHEPLTEEEHDSYLSIITEHDLQGVDDVELQGVDVNLEYDFNSHEIIIFVLYVDDFLVGSSSQSMLDDLYQVLVDKYQIVSRSKGDELEFLSMKLIFNRDTDTVDISMPKHIDDITSWVTDSKDELSITKKL